MRQTANGRTYYLNHMTRTTQWENPCLGGDTEGGEEGEWTSDRTDERNDMRVDNAQGAVRNSVIKPAEGGVTLVTNNGAAKSPLPTSGDPNLMQML